MAASDVLTPPGWRDREALTPLTSHLPPTRAEEWPRASVSFHLAAPSNKVARILKWGVGEKALTAVLATKPPPPHCFWCYSPGGSFHRASSALGWAGAT